jgi:predicted permease
MEWIGLVPVGLKVSPDARVFAFAAAVAILTGIFCGILPAMRASRTDPGTALQQTSRTTHGSGAGLRSFLAAAQIALSMVLLFSAGLFIGTLENLRNANTGYRREGLLLMQLLPQHTRERIPNRAVYFRELLDKITRIPGITGAGFSYYGPVTSREFREAVSATGAPSAAIQSVQEMVAPGYFRVMGVRLVAGRDFSWQDDEHAPKVAVISESLARDLFGNGNPLGRRITMANRPELKDAEIIGVVNSASLWRVDSHKPPAAYAAMLQNADYNEPMLDIRTSGDPLLVARPASAVLTAAGRHYSVRTQTWRERLDMFLTDERMLGVLSGFFGALALILAGIGLYGLLSEAVTSRTTEIGVRMAIGAERGQVLRMFLVDAARLLAIGIGAGTAIGLGASRLIASRLFGVSPLSFSAIILPAAVLAITGSLATLVPARRASRVDPMTALRPE